MENSLVMRMHPAIRSRYGMDQSLGLVDAKTQMLDQIGRNLLCLKWWFSDL